MIKEAGGLVGGALIFSPLGMLLISEEVFDIFFFRKSGPFFLKLFIPCCFIR